MLVKRSASAEPAAAFDPKAALRDLDAPDPALRRHAAQALRQCPDALDELCRRLAVEPEGDVRARAPEQSDRAEIAGSRGQAGLDLRQGRRRAAQRGDGGAVGDAGGVHRQDAGHGRLSRRQAAPAGGERPQRVPDPRAVELLEQVLVLEDDVNICLAAVDGLAHGGDFRSAGRLAAFAARFPEVDQAQFVVQSLLRSFGATR